MSEILTFVKIEKSGEEEFVIELEQQNAHTMTYVIIDKEGSEINEEIPDTLTETDENEQIECLIHDQKDEIQI